ncbi:MAG: hypothetical protein AABZ33_02335 [Chloroflexota bacterium]
MIRAIRPSVVRRRGPWRALVGAGALGSILVIGAVWTNALGAGDRFESLEARVARFIAGPVPERSTLPTVAITPAPTHAPPTPALPTPTPDPAAPTPTGASPSPDPTPAPTPVRAPVDVSIIAQADAAAMFSSQVTKDWCSPAGVQMVLAVLGLADTSEGFQRELAGRIGEWESWDDSHNGGWGPASMALALADYGAVGYEIRAYATRALALHDSARAIAETGAPVVLLAWRGAHTWVLTGYRADADPRLFADATVSGAYVLDPWYPRNSSIWGPSDPPGTFQDSAEMVRNFLPWKRPEGRYPDRDGRFIALIPTVVVDPVGPGRVSRAGD